MAEGVPYTVAEVAGLEKVSAKTIYGEIAKGKLRARRIGTVLRIDRDEHEAWRRRSLVAKKRDTFDGVLKAAERG